MNNDFYAADRNANDQQRTRRLPDQPRYQARSSRNSNRGSQGNSRSNTIPQRSGNLRSGNQGRNHTRRKDNRTTNNKMPGGRRSSGRHGRGRRNNAGHGAGATNDPLLNSLNILIGSEDDADDEYVETPAVASTRKLRNPNTVANRDTNVPTGPRNGPSQRSSGGHMTGIEQGRGGQQRGGRPGRGGQSTGSVKWCIHCDRGNHNTDECWKLKALQNANQASRMEIDGEPSLSHCPICDGSNHIPEECFHRGKPKCTNCNRFGHVAEACRKPPKNGQRSKQGRSSTNDDHMVGANPFGITNGEVISRAAVQHSNAQTQELAVSSNPAPLTSLQDVSQSIDLHSLIAKHVAKVDKVEVIVPQSGQFVLSPDRPLYDKEGDLVWNGGVAITDGDYQQIVHLPQSSVPEQVMRIPTTVSSIPQFGSYQPIPQPITINLINNITTNSHNNTTVNHQGFVTPTARVDEVEDEVNDDEASEEELGGHNDEEEADQDACHVNLSNAKSSNSKNKMADGPQNLMHSYWQTQNAALAPPPSAGHTGSPAESQQSSTELQHQTAFNPRLQEKYLNLLSQVEQKANHASVSFDQLIAMSMANASTSTLPPVSMPSVSAASHKAMAGSPLRRPTPQHRNPTTSTFTPLKHDRENDESEVEQPPLKKPKFSSTAMEVAMHVNGGNIFAASAHLEAQDSGEPTPRSLRSLRETTSVLDPLPPAQTPARLTLTQAQPTSLLASTPSPIQAQSTSTRFTSRSKRSHTMFEEVENVDDVPTPAPSKPQRPSCAKSSAASSLPAPSSHKRKRSFEIGDEHDQHYQLSPPSRQVAEPQDAQDVSPPTLKRARIGVPLEELQVPGSFPQELLHKLGDHRPGKPSIVKLLYPPGQIRRHISPLSPKRTPRVSRPQAQHAHQPSLERAPMPIPRRPALSPKPVSGDHQPQVAVAGDVRQSDAAGTFGAIASSVGGVLRGAYRWYTGTA
jgi:hypothetical protein